MLYVIFLVNSCYLLLLCGTKMPRKNTVLNRQARKMVYDVYCFMKDEAGGVKTLNQIYLRTAQATKTSVTTVNRIIKESQQSEFLTVFSSPGKKRKRSKPVTDIDNFDKGVIKRCIHNFHKTEKELPTIKKLLNKIRSDINFQGCATSLRQIIKELGFKWKTTENNRKILIEQTKIRLQRINYLEKIKKYRQEKRTIIYTDESYVHATHTKSKSWSDGSNEGLKKPI